MAAMTPVRISPLPPFAMPGLPVIFTAMRPSGWAISVRQPLRTSVTLWRLANSRARGSRLAWTCFVLMPVRRAISPGWGVRTMVRPDPSIRSGWLARMFRASASMTMGRSVFWMRQDKGFGFHAHTGADGDNGGAGEEFFEVLRVEVGGINFAGGTFGEGQRHQLGRDCGD